MKKLYKLTIHSSLSTETIWHLLAQENVDVLYSSAEEESIEFFVSAETDNLFKDFDWIENYEETVLPEINWEDQWSLHGYNYKEGVVNIPLGRYGRSGPDIRLQPGPGFGDLSHPTTHLMLTLMGRYLDKHSVVDIGCGSGVLSIAAIAMGASFAYGIDIDVLAIEHSQYNAQLNDMGDFCQFSLPDNFFPPTHSTLLINMISSEQVVAWNGLANLHHRKGHCISSGIRTEERTNYIQLTSRWGWHLKEEIELEGWLGFLFECDDSTQTSLFEITYS